MHEELPTTAADRLLRIGTALIVLSVAALLATLAYLVIIGAPASGHEPLLRAPLAANACRSSTPQHFWIVNGKDYRDCSEGGGTEQVECCCIEGSVYACSDVIFTTGGTYWDDLQIPGFALRVGGTAPTFASWATHAPLYVYFFGASTDEEVHGSIQMPHRWAGTAIKFHVHWFPEATADGAPANQAVRWCINYTWAEYGTAFPAVSNSCSVTHGPADANVVIDRMYITNVADISPGTTADQASSVLYFRLYRDANDAADTYEGRAGLLSVDAHFESNKLGSDNVDPD